MATPAAVLERIRGLLMVKGAPNESRPIFRSLLP
ncbi:hypothetical protein FOCG_10726 [Fusarium oxysporum f. sp. radicis-lycopersici 26381]|uniref:Uncharacterized protein n=6 Tax=Fusarium oxysporum TaxID=5507 RepID=W9HWZ9_FUSOX|nr:hypothetical protein FOXG_20010 [Fusarium oxysporum f. sp. lycopersici 4287]EWY87143.1 hypothetical protein FOYG_11384 [Fusarium oxysporum NRRL 32931]EWZ34540.1 hypothetical protein FOZG_12497 [Fusarium oxysporum Fo47]EXA38493.1 hypothetical protein FOVG_10422 [Fusarium oxysporum f. sp. pisi HDV247]EXK37182.1 hypothetical protein FOMG_08033 [Fusarium oxysporum f. sp. melonis 26406]EXL48255.1 hypothetical protein FOCG_10726 [Fusarium oxysporum f. sp. radicis-lycopersici 26381]EXL83412.1 hyp